MAPSCAPSRLPNMPEALGFPGVIVGADYPGLGPNGQLHAYMSGLAEGRSMVDIVRAARIIGGTGVGARWIAAGASQGGHASLWAGQVARTEARDLDLLGVIAFAPSSESTTPFANDNPALGGAVTAMSLYGRATDDRRLDPAKYASPAVAKWSAILSQKCLADATAAFAALGDAARWKADPKTTEPARSIWLANDPGRAKTGKPILIIQGETDEVVIPARTRALIKRECALGEQVAAVFVPDTTHYTVVVNSKAPVAAWMAARLRGQAPADKICGEL